MVRWKTGAVTLACDELREYVKGRRIALMMNTTALDNEGRLLIDRIAEELGHTSTIIATGGLAQFVTPLCRHEIILEKELLLKGLNIIYKKNKR